ncbi:MAG: hypothetical protein NVSMB22_27440 [Chloroflexota bacterium]
MRMFYRSLMTLLAAACAIGAVPPGGVTGTQAVAPSLHFTTRAGYKVAVAGVHWGAQRSVLFTVKAAGGPVSVALKSAQDGRFLVGITKIDLCGGSTYRATNMATRASVKLKGPALLCPNRLPESKPVVTVLHGTSLPTREVDVVGAELQGASDLHVGDVLAVYEPGNDRPAFVPDVDARYFAPVAHGTQVSPCPPTPSTRTCTAATTVSFYWKWQAIRAGTTGLHLTPACRQAVPACGLADRLVRLHILA